MEWIYKYRRIIMAFPVYQNTKCDYFRLGELQFEAMIKDMEKAEKFIFMEYFIINTGKLWDKISNILIRKAAQGVEVRILYDDFGCIATLPDHFIRTMRTHGIHTSARDTLPHIRSFFTASR